MKTLILALVVMAAGAASAQDKVTLPNGDEIVTLADNTTWMIMQPKGDTAAFLLDKTMPTVGAFGTFIVTDLPESDIVGAPQSIKIGISGNCQSRTYQIMNGIKYSGKMGGGMPDLSVSQEEPEGVLRKVESGSLIAAVFKVVCKH